MKATIKRSVALLGLALVLVLVSADIAGAAPLWPDVDADVLAPYGRTEADLAGISTGYPDGTWQPFMSMPRRQFVKMAVEAFGIPMVAPVPAVFPDVSSDDEFYPYIQAAYAAGLIQGVGGGRFAPDGTVTRQQGAVIIARYIAGQWMVDLQAEYTETDVATILEPFSDAGEVSSVVVKDVAYAIEKGVFEGSDGQLAPFDSLSRLQAAALLVRSIEAPLIKTDVRAFVNRAQRYIQANGKEAAVAEFMDHSGSFYPKNGELYIFAYDLNDDGMCLCLPPVPDWVGTNLWDLEDDEGTYFIRDFYRIARTIGSGWSAYRYLNPSQGNEVQDKMSYIVKVDDTWLIGAGAYGLTDTPTTYTPPMREDLSGLSWTEAFDKLHEKMSREYAFTVWKGIDWEALYDEYQPRIAAAQAADDEKAYYLSLEEFIQELRDGHASVKGYQDPAVESPSAAQTLILAVQQELAGGGFGLVATKLDDDTVIASWVKAEGPAAAAGMVVGAQIVEWGGRPVSLALAETSVVLGPSQATDARREYEKLRFLVRAPVGADRAVSFRNQGEEDTRTVTLTAVDDAQETLIMTDSRSILAKGWPEKMVEHDILPGNVGYVRVYLEMDLPADLPGDHTPTLQLFQEAIDEFIDAQVAGIIVDIRNNAGGLDEMSADLLGSFYAERTLYEYPSFRVPGTERFEIWQQDATTLEYHSPGQGTWIEPAARRYAGPVVALVNMGCISSGEGVAKGIKNLPNGSVVGFYGTNGSFGMAGDKALMPGGFEVDWPYGRSLDRDKMVQIDSRDGQGGVLPDVRIPMTLENALKVRQGQDVELEYGLRALSGMPAD